jgi:hypothetical protein
LRTNLVLKNAIRKKNPFKKVVKVKERMKVKYNKKKLKEDKIIKK